MSENIHQQNAIAGMRELAIPEGSTWGDDKIKCRKANGHDGDHETADGYTFGDDPPKCFTCKGTGANYDSATGLMICNRCNGTGKAL